MPSEPRYHQPVVVTGGSRGIGLSIAQYLTSAGVPTGIIAQSEKNVESAVEALSENRVPVYGRTADVSQESEIAQAIADIADRLGGIGGLVCSAGVHPATANVEDYSVELWNHLMSVNLLGSFLAVKSSLNWIRMNHGGSIVLIGSPASRRGFARAHGYVAAKHGLIGLTRSLAIELGPSDIRVNLVCPGFVETDMTRNKDDLRQWSVGASPLGRIVEVDDVAQTVGFLLRRDIVSITSQVIAVCGGITW
jgi:NAD(P)-dependent dehydrogenase (short-subunit alcohol dehydrogenase family)